MKHGPGALIPEMAGAEPETLAAAYAAWDAAREQHAQLFIRAGAERERIEVEGRFLVGAARAAAGIPASVSPSHAGSSLATPDRLQALVAEAEARVATGREALDRQLAAEFEASDRTCTQAETVVRERVARYASGAAVPVRLMLRPVGSARAVLHLGRPSPDEAVLLLHLLTGCIPSRHLFLDDESTDERALGAPPLYPDAGVTRTETRPTPGQLVARLTGHGTVLPVRGFIPVQLHREDGGRDAFRFLQRGPVLELEQLVGEDFASVLPLEQTERVAGLLLRLRVEGRVLLDVRSG